MKTLACIAAALLAVTVAAPVQAQTTNRTVPPVRRVRRGAVAAPSAASAQPITTAAPVNPPVMTPAQAASLSGVYAFWFKSRAICLVKQGRFGEEEMRLALIEKMKQLGVDPSFLESKSVMYIAPRLAEILPPSCDPNDLPAGRINSLIRQESAKLERASELMREINSEIRCRSTMDKTGGPQSACDRIEWPTYPILSPILR